MFTDRNGDMRRRNGETEHVGCMFEQVHKQLLKRKYDVHTKQDNGAYSRKDTRNTCVILDLLD